MSSQLRPDLSTASKRADKPVAADLPECLSNRLKQSTRELHHEAERSGVIRQLITRCATLDAYVSYLRNLYPIYVALEQNLSGLRSLPEFQVVADPALARSKALEADMTAIVGADWRALIPVLESAEHYAQTITAASPAGLVAHAYVRYLGDLNGGLIIKRLLRDSLALSDAQLAFYDFPAIADIPLFRERFKTSLDELAVSHDAEAIVDEALLAFAMATQLSIDIEIKQK